MVDSDPISSDATPHKRRKLDTAGTGRAWDSQNDSGEEFTADDFETAATVPLNASQKRKLQFGPEQFRRDFSLHESATLPRQIETATAPFVTQPTQPLRTGHVTQPTQPWQSRTTPPRSPNVLVRNSSPAAGPLASPPSLAPPNNFTRPFPRPGGGLLARTLAPAGSAFRPPLGVRPKPASIAVADDSDDEHDPPVSYIDEETQGQRSNIRPTNFLKNGRGLDSTPNRSDRIIPQSPQPPTGGTIFSSLMSNFGHDPSQPTARPPPRMTGDMASAYGNVSRRPRPQQSSSQQAAMPARKRLDMVRYKTLDDIEDFTMRQNVEQLQAVLAYESVQRCMDALSKTKNNPGNAQIWLMDKLESNEVDDDIDELANTPGAAAKKGVASAKSFSTQRPLAPSQPTKAAAKQHIQAPTKSIAQKYTEAAQVRKPAPPVIDLLDDDEGEEDVRPKGRLLKARKPRSQSPPSSPPKKPIARPRKVVAIDSDGESDAEGLLVEDDSEVEEVQLPNSFDERLLKFFNECSARDLAELSAQPESVATFVLEKRPFASLDAVRSITNATTKSGKASKARALGDRIVDLCEKMWTGYDAVDELVEECAKIALPIQEALKGWGIGKVSDGELQLMNLDEAHDSGIGTPTSSTAADDAPVKTTSSKNARFLTQPDNMNSDLTLKDYQLVGLNWLNLLWSKKLSCILADDMGLGKTCQVISFLAHLQLQEVDGVHLVIVPGSTLENWLREFNRFAPSMNVVPYYGSQAERAELRVQIEEDFNSIDVVVTTYDIAVKADDNRFLRKHVQPAVCIYDEAHALRNPNSQRYTELMRIPADFKILLTGTPLQNNLQELVAVLAFIMPDLFRAKEENLSFVFQHKATTKDSDSAALLSAERIARARTMMTPFILRRKKHQVLDLPAKHSHVDKCDMTQVQEQYYHQLIDEAQQLFSTKAKKKADKAAHAKQTNNILMALRQAAIHPLLRRRLYTDAKLLKIQKELLRHPEWAGNRPDQVRDYLNGDAAQSLKGGDFGLHTFCMSEGREYLQKFALKNEEWMDSGKVQKFRELVLKYIANGDRTLVFSQFTTLMDILEAVLESLDIKFLRLDGSTSMNIRQAMIDTFYEDDTIKIFMLSTKAGGAGINLACANKVIIFDSGFNPQDDVQAENRAHRVGQTREVEVVRLVSRGTIEEQIHALGESKLALDERVAGEAVDEKAAETHGKAEVERMFLETLQKKEREETPKVKAEEPLPVGGDIRDAFKAGMERKGVKIASKQKQF